jgi:nifR3 family TIM-barrel protein
MESGFWKKLKRPIMAMAPMSGITDEAFRLMLLKYGKPDVFWTEFISVDGLFSEKGRKYCLNVLKFNPKERPIVAQVFGGDPDFSAQGGPASGWENAAKIIESLGFDGIDINMGCPNRDIEKIGGGAALMKTPALAKEIIKATKKGAGNIPVSVKTRIGYSKNEIADWIPAILEEKVAALTVHFRARAEMFAPPAHWELAEEIVKLRDNISPETLIIGNGDVKSVEEARELVKKTGIDGVMFGRSALGDPWFFATQKPTIPERLNAVIEHSLIFDDLHKENMDKDGHYKQFDAIKKHFHCSVKGFNGAKELRESLMAVKSTAEAKNLIQNFLK